VLRSLHPINSLNVNFGVAEFRDDLLERQFMKFRVGAIHELPLP
jgi:hypothetical protein